MRKLGSDGKEQRSGGVGATSIGTLAARPAASLVGPGAVYWATDTGAVYRSDGTSWVGPLNPGAELDYAQITAPVTGVTASTEATAVTLVSGNSVTYDGSKVKVEVYVPAVAAATNAWYYRVLLLRDSTVIGYAAGKSLAADAANGVEFYAAAFDTPAAGAHTYKASAYVQASTNFSFLAGAGGSGNLLPAFLRVTKA